MNDSAARARLALPRVERGAIHGTEHGTKHGAFRFGAWLVDPSANTVESADDKRQMEPRTMQVLVALCQARGAIVSGDDLLTQCWGSALTGDSPLHKNIAHLRRILGDSASAPQYIETIRLRGYRTVAPLDFGPVHADGRKNWQTGSPFRGLLAFDQTHTDVFFGRDDITRHLVDVARAQVHEQTQGGLALMLVLGPSGAGKTSLIQAGLLPALARPDPASPLVLLLASTTFDLVDQGEQTLFTALAGALLDLQWDDQWAFAGANAVALGARLEHDGAAVAAALAAQLAVQAQQRPGARVGIFLDRFEALFNATRIAEAERRRFLATLEQLARSSAVLLVIACRNDFYPSIAQYRLLTDSRRQGGHVDLEPPAFSDIAQMIRRPAAAARLTFGVDPHTQARLDDVLCASAADSPDALPLLQYCLHELYRLRTDDGELGFEAFRQLGGLEGAIGQRAEQAVRALDSAQQAALSHVMSLVVVLSVDGANVSSQRAPWAALRDDAARQTVTALIQSRLFVSDLVGGVPVFGIAHDAILRCWPRMTDWIAAHRSALAVRGRLAQHAGRWRDEGKPVDLLLARGKLLDEAKALRDAGSWSLTEWECALIAASDRRGRQRERLRVLALSMIVVLAVLASGLGASAMLAKRAADLRRNEAEGLMDFMLGDFADKLRPLGRLALLESVSGKALQFLSNADDSDLTPAALTLRAKGMQILGEVSRSRGDSQQALDAFGKARAILLRQLAMAPRDLQVLKNLGANAYWMAQIHKDQNNWIAAEDDLRGYLKYADLLHQYDPDNPEWWVEQSYAHNNLGALAQTRGKPAQAAPSFVASIALKRRALDRTPDSADVAVELADSYSWLASARESLGELDEARRLYEQEMHLVLRLRERYPGESMWINRHVRALQHRALIALALGSDDDALRDYDAARQLFMGIVAQDPNNHIWQVDLASVEQERLRILGRRAGTRPGALAPQLAEVHRTMQALLALDPKNASWARREAVARTRLAGALQAGDRPQAAAHELDQALTRLRQLHQDNPSDQSLRLALIDALLQSASMQQQQGKLNINTLSCTQAYGMISADIELTKDYLVLDPWVRINLCLQNHQLADTAVKRLQQIGYRDPAYVRHLLTYR